MLVSLYIYKQYVESHLRVIILHNDSCSGIVDRTQPVKLCYLYAVLLIDRPNEWQSRQWYHMQSRHVYIHLLLCVRVENRHMQMIEISKKKQCLQGQLQAIKKNQSWATMR